MKNLFFTFLLSSCAWALTAQQNIQLNIEPMLGANSFALNQVTDAVGYNYQYKLTRLEYYISQIKITHDGGQITPLVDWYILARPTQTNVHNLGTYSNIQNVEAITFSIGVDQERNHADPSAIGTPQVLTPQVPEMHWGWSAGYRFLAIEGKAGTNFNQIFEIHALGDANYKTLTFPVTAEQVDASTKMIHLTANYANILKAVEVGSGAIVHGTSGKAITVMNNMGTEVFSVASVGVISPAFDGKFVVSPNPSTSKSAFVNYAMANLGDYEVTVTDMIGRQVFRKAIIGTEGTVLLENATETGTYFVHLWKDGTPIAFAKLVVAQ